MILRSIGRLSLGVKMIRQAIVAMACIKQLTVSIPASLSRAHGFSRCSDRGLGRATFCIRPTHEIEQRNELVELGVTERRDDFLVGGVHVGVELVEQGAS